MARWPVASAYINEYIGAKRRGRFFLLYEAMFLVGLVGAGLIGYLLVPAAPGGKRPGGRQAVG